MSASQADEEVLFHAARQIDDGAARARYLREAAGGDEGLLGRVEALLGAHDAPDRLLDRPAAARAATEACGPPAGDEAASVTPRECAGTRIGPFKLLHKIGEGGMGVVWMAQQTQPVQRKVALKVIKPGMDSKQVIARFEAERQALALMDHPNIARIFDAGTTESGRPYFVMELAHGVPITRYCDDNRLTPRERLELFVPVCQAVQHAHQKGVIHRDLKPSNVLVALSDGKPVPKVIDFGVAKAAGQPLTEKTLVTGLGSIVGTLEYMSPEQAEFNQLDIDTRSDVYSLGVLLYELLTGSTPFGRKEMEQGGMLEMLRVIREDEPSKPSTKLSTAEGLPALAANRGTDPARLTALLRGELDWIVMKALDKDRNRRYETANAYAADLKRYLADEPVLACPPSSWYWFGKFARRNRAALAMTGLVLLAALILVGGVVWGILEAAWQRTKTTAEAVPALADVERWVARSKWPEARAALARARAVLDSGRSPADLSQLVAELEKDLDLVDRLDSIRLNRFRPHQGDGWREEEIERMLVDYSAMDRAYAEAFRDFGLFDVDDLDPAAAASRIRGRAVAAELAAALDDWALVRRKRLKPEGRWRPLLETASLADPDSWRNRVREAAANDDWKAMSELASSANVQALSPRSLHLLAVNLSEGTSVHIRQAKALLLRAHWHHPDDFWINYQLGADYEWDGAIAYAEAALGMRGQNIHLLYQIGRIHLQWRAFDVAIEVFETVLRLDPPELERAMAHEALGTAWFRKGNHDRALAEFRKALRCKSVTSMQPLIRNGIGNTLLDQGKLNEAIDEFRAAIRLAPDFAAAYHNLGIAYRRNKAPDKALEAFHAAIKCNPKLYPAHCELASLWLEQGALAEALESAEESVRLRPDSAENRINLGRVLHRLGCHYDALDEFRRAIHLAPDAVLAYYNLAVALQKTGHVDEAIAACKEVIWLNPKHRDAHELLGALHHARGSYETSAGYFRRAIALGPKIAMTRYKLGVCLTSKGDHEGAIRAYREAVAIDPRHARAWENLGIHLLLQGKLPDALEAQRRAIAVDPTRPQAHNNLAAILERLDRLDDAIDSGWQAVRLDKNYANARLNLGWALTRSGDLKGGLAQLEVAARLNPNDFWVQYRLGVVRRESGDLAGAESALRKAIGRNPSSAQAHCDLGHVLQAQGRFLESYAAHLQGHQLGSRDPAWRQPSAQWVRKAEAFVEMNALLPSILAGHIKPKNAARQIDFATVCRFKKLFVAASRFYHDGFAAQPRFAQDLRAGFRFAAAQSAALAAAGEGDDAGGLTKADRAELRKQAVAWLRADLKLWTEHLRKGPPQARAEVEKATSNWLRDLSFAGLREKAALEKLPESTRELCRKLWADVEALRLQARGQEKSG